MQQARKKSNSIDQMVYRECESKGVTKKIYHASYGGTGRGRRSQELGPQKFRVALRKTIAQSR